MKITVLCSSEAHPINDRLQDWVRVNKDKHDVELVRRKSDMSGGDLLFLISCSEIIGPQARMAYRKSLVIHASNLPEGRGWSPHIWQILEGKTEIVVSLLEAADKVDSGDIWHQLRVSVPKSALYDEINDLIFDAEFDLMDFAVSNFDRVIPKAQRADIKPTYYPRRSPKDSELNPALSIAEQFDLMRVCDPERFPAFFKLHDCKYKIRLEKMTDE